MRAEPSTDADVVATLSAGQQASATGESQVVDDIPWLEIHQEPSGRTGWVAAIGPDGSSWLAVVEDGPLGATSGQDVELVDPTTGVRSPLTSGMSVVDLAFAPDGRRVALIDRDRGPQVVAADALFNLDPTPVPHGPFFGPPVRGEVAFSANGEAVSFLEGQNFLGLQMIWFAEGQAPTFAEFSTLYPISWSPDSQRIAGAQWINVGTSEPENWGGRYRRGGTAAVDAPHEPGRVDSALPGRRMDRPLRSCRTPGTPPSVWPS